MSQWMENARAGDVGAMYALGWNYYGGTGGVARDYGEALHWYEKAAAKGHSRAHTMLGNIHEKGYGTPVNLLRALNHYKQAKEMGVDNAESIARVEAAIAADPRAARSNSAAAATEATAIKAARLEQEKSRVEQQDADNKQKDAELKEREAAITEKEAELKKQQEAFEADRVRQQQALDAEQARLQQLEEAIKRERDAIDTIKREQEAQQHDKEAAAAAFKKTKKDAAAAKQAEILEERHAEGSTYVPTRETVAAAWEPTKVKLADCPVHAGPLTPGQSVLLEKCLHVICRDCVPHVTQPDNSVRCPICNVDSPLERDSLPHHPFIEAELASGETHTCIICAPMPEEDQLPAVVKCTACDPHKYFCEAHAAAHRKRMPAHTIEQLPHGGAPLRCPTHDQPITAYCTSCRQLICFACFATTHPSATHTARLLTDMAFVEGVRTRLAEGVTVARMVADALVNHAADATVAVTELDERDAGVASEIDRTINVLAGMLERRREAAHDQRLARTRDERALLQTTREESEYHWRIITSAADLAEQLAVGTHLGVNATAVMVQLEEAASARLNAVLELASERGVPPPAILRFQFDESIGDMLAELGEIIQDA